MSNDGQSEGRVTGERRLVEVSPELEAWIMAKRWTVYVCAEPDGQDCASGTHPHILRHECAALRRWHEAMAARKSPDDPVDEPGPVVVMVEVQAVPSQSLMAG